MNSGCTARGRRVASSPYCRAETMSRSLIRLHCLTVADNTSAPLRQNRVNRAIDVAFAEVRPFSRQQSANFRDSSDRLAAIRDKDIAQANRKLKRSLSSVSQMAAIPGVVHANSQIFQ